MTVFLEFVSQQWLLVSALMVLFALLYFHENRKSGAGVTPSQLSSMVNQQQGVVVDLRDASEYKKGHITDSINIASAQLKNQLPQLEKYKETPIILVCKMGQHSSMAGKQLKEAGFTQVYRLTGGIAEWTNAQLPLVGKVKEAKESKKSKKNKNSKAVKKGD